MLAGLALAWEIGSEAALLEALLREDCWDALGAYTQRFGWDGLLAA